MPRTISGRMLVGFIAGALAVLTFHQGVVTLLYLTGLIARMPYSFTPTAPLGVPVVLSAAFFGGLWGAAMLVVLPPARRRSWTAGLAFGAILPSAVSLAVVSPLKGQPLEASWDLGRIAVSLAVNGAWGLGTVLIARWLAALGPLRGARMQRR
jgi:hypothetical protein